MERNSKKEILEPLSLGESRRDGGSEGALVNPGTPKATHSMILGELLLFGAWDFGKVSHVVGSLIPT